MTAAAPVPGKPGAAAFRATMAWMVMMLAETANGYVREVFIAPEIGALRAKQLGVVVGSVLVLLVSALLARWLAVHTRGGRWLVGAWWVALTVAFELGVGRAMGLSWPRLLADFNPAQGGWLLGGLLVMLCAPTLTARRSA